MGTISKRTGMTKQGSVPALFPLLSASFEYIEEYKLDGAVFHSAFSCRTEHTGILLQAEILKKVYRNIPILLMEGDIVDISSYNEADTHSRIDSFIEVLSAEGNRCG